MNDNLKGFLKYHGVLLMHVLSGRVIASALVMVVAYFIIRLC